MKRTEVTNLGEVLRELKDFRRGQGRMHPIDVVLMIVVMGVMSGCRGYEALMDFIERERDSLIRYLKPKKARLPSKPTLWRVMTHLDEKAFMAIFTQWIASFHTVFKEEIVAIDGKAIGQERVSDENRKMAHLVSLFSIHCKETLMMEKTAHKSNEIPLVRQMIEAMEQEGLVYTLDAMHCQKETLKTIIDNHCDYIVGVKGNQKKTV